MAEDLQTLRPADGLTFEFDGASRICTLIEMEHLAIMPTRIPVPFAHLKNAVAQVLTAEAEAKVATLPASTKLKDYPPGVRGKLRVAQILMDEAMAEITAASVAQDMDHSGSEKATDAAARAAAMKLLT